MSPARDFGHDRALEGATMGWLVVKIPLRDVIGGALLRLDRELSQAQIDLVVGSTLRPGGVVYCTSVDGSSDGRVEYYFNPVAAELYGTIAAKHGAKPCNEPDLARLSVALADIRQT